MEYDEIYVIINRIKKDLISSKSFPITRIPIKAVITPITNARFHTIGLVSDMINDLYFCSIVFCNRILLKVVQYSDEQLVVFNSFIIQVTRRTKKNR